MGVNAISGIRFGCLVVVISWVVGCGPTIKEHVTHNESYDFTQKDKTVCLYIDNQDTWHLEHNQILEKKIYLSAADLLTQNGFSVLSDPNKAEYFFALIFQTETGQTPVTSRTAMKTQMDVLGGGGLTQVPETHVSGGNTYHAVNVIGACFDCRTKEQVFHERTSAKMLKISKLLGYDEEDMYIEPVKEILAEFMSNF